MEHWKPASMAPRYQALRGAGHRPPRGWTALLALLACLITGTGVAAPFAEQERAAPHNTAQVSLPILQAQALVQAPTRSEQPTAPVETTPAAEPGEARTDPVREDGTAGAKDGPVLAWSAGLAIGAPPIPVESDLTGSGVPVELFTDLDYGPWLRLRLALNRSAAETGDVTLETTAVTIAYRHPFPVTETISGEILGGIAQLSGTLASGGAAALNASTVGLVAGVVLHRVWAGMVVSVEYQLLFGDGNFDGLTVNLGSNQLLLAAAYRFY